MTDLDREFLHWLATRGSADALRAGVAARFGERVENLDAWLRSLEARGLVLDPFGTEERCVLTDAGIAQAKRPALQKDAKGIFGATLRPARC